MATFNFTRETFEKYSDSMLGAHSERFCRLYRRYADDILSTRSALNDMKVLVIPTIGNDRPVVLLISELGVDIIYREELISIVGAEISILEKICLESGNLLDMDASSYPKFSNFTLTLNENI